ncbi:MAG: hypothetical protein AUG80_14655 [Candidatus Rokubacteria bacterium 13_1_20CM_4_68_9]|nr:MAG: hypothetical protein AUG80_14655 [Candidatus Rokubacteria bacterium 13_1_20CM_4_68_9]
MMRAVGVFAVGLVLVWVIAHVFYLGPVKDATEMALVWTVWVTVAASVVASLTVLAFGLIAGGSRPAWLRFVQSARTVAAGGSRRGDSRRVEDAVDAVRWLRDRRSAFGGGWRG